MCYSCGSTGCSKGLSSVCLFLLLGLSFPWVFSCYCHKAALHSMRAVNWWRLWNPVRHLLPDPPTLKRGNVPWWGWSSYTQIWFSNPWFSWHWLSTGWLLLLTTLFRTQISKGRIYLLKSRKLNKHNKCIVVG